MTAATTHLALIRHGQSEWNLQNRFTGWVDVDLTERGIAEAEKAGQLLMKTGIDFNAAYTSVQKRAIRTLWLSLTQMNRVWMPVTKDWRLNERHYGGLTGLDKAQTAEKHGKEQVHIWRRSYDIPPPAIEADNPHNPNTDPQYAHLKPSQLPQSESLKMTLDRVLPAWQNDIAPHLIAGKNLIISAHGNSLRALVKLLMKVSDEDIPSIEIPTGNPLLFTFETGTLTPTSVHYLDTERARPLPPLPTS